MRPGQSPDRRMPARGIEPRSVGLQPSGLPESQTGKLEGKGSNLRYTVQSRASYH